MVERIDHKEGLNIPLACSEGCELVSADTFFVKSGVHVSEAGCDCPPDMLVNVASALHMSLKHGNFKEIDEVEESVKTIIKENKSLFILLREGIVSGHEYKVV